MFKFSVAPEWDYTNIDKYLSKNNKYIMNFEKLMMNAEKLAMDGNGKKMRIPRIHL